MEFDIHFVIEHIKKLQQVHNTKLRTEISNIDDGMITYCFNINDDKKKAIKIHPINIDIESMQKEFVENHNKMILLSIIYCLNNEFRKLSFKNQITIINEMMEININSCIVTRNDKNVRFYKLDKKSINYYSSIPDYSNGMIDLFANIFNINIFIIEYNDGRYPIGWFSLTNKFNVSKPSIILWHPNKFMYYPVSINYDFKFYKEIKLFDSFLKNKIIYVDPILIDNKTAIKDINITNEKVIDYGYDNDLEIIYKYKITPSRKARKSRWDNATKELDKDEKNSSENVSIEEVKEPLSDKSLNDKLPDKSLNDDSNIDCSTERAINDVVIASFDKESLNKMTKVQIEELMKEHQLKLTFKSEGKYIKKTKDQMIDELLKKNSF